MHKNPKRIFTRSIRTTSSVPNIHHSHIPAKTPTAIGQNNHRTIQKRTLSTQNAKFPLKPNLTDPKSSNPKISVFLAQITNSQIFKTQPLPSKPIKRRMSGTAKMKIDEKITIEGSDRYGQKVSKLDLSSFNCVNKNSILKNSFIGENCGSEKNMKTSMFGGESEESRGIERKNGHQKGRLVMKKNRLENNFVYESKKGGEEWNSEIVVKDACLSKGVYWNKKNWWIFSKEK